MSMTINETIAVAENEELEIDLYRIDWPSDTALQTWGEFHFTAAQVAEALHIKAFRGVLSFTEDQCEAWLEGFIEAHYGVKAEGFRWQWDVNPQSMVAVA